MLFASWRNVGRPANLSIVPPPFSLLHAKIDGYAIVHFDNHGADILLVLNQSKSSYEVLLGVQMKN